MTHPARGRPRAGGGFTLVELLVVMVIAALILGLGFTGLQNGSRRSKEAAFVQDFASELKRARIAAGRSGRPAVFRIRPDKKLYGSGAAPRGRIPENVEVFAASVEKDPESGEVRVFFNPDGSANEREFQIRFDKSRDFLVHIHPLFGAVRWEKRT